MIRELTAEDAPLVGAQLPLNRLDTWRAGSTSLGAWKDGVPVGHAHLVRERTELGAPELQDVHVAPARPALAVDFGAPRSS